MRGRVIEPGVVQTRLNGQSVLFSNVLGKVIGRKGRDGKWTGDSDGGGVIHAKSPIGLRMQQRADSDANF